jgi:hypothetical protein
MARTTIWRTSLDGQPVEIRAIHDVRTRDFAIHIDGFPIRRQTLPEMLWRGFRVEAPMASHTVAITVIPTEDSWRYEAEVDGRTLQIFGAETSLHQEVDGRYARIGALPFDPVRHARLFPRWYVAAALVGVLGAALAGGGVARAIEVGALTRPVQATLVGAFTCAFTAFAWWYGHTQRTRDLLLTGAVHPAVVVALDPVRVALVVDRSVEPEHQEPAALVIRQPLDRLRPVRVGERTVALVRFDHTQDGVRWSGISAIAAAAATADDHAVDALRDSIPEAAWERLKVDLQIAGRPTEVGQHALLPRSRFAPRQAERAG